ncbi:MAG TPA: type II toxin-antitoxin system VapC family toxin, partial [Bryobacteraceae bacterium]|nr:type II toxin-antitoxin system VapC family toxin [Bryobacteraceae bacterium]
MLDTSAYSALMHGDQAVMNVVSMAAEILVPAVVLGELHSGFKRGTRTRENVAQLDRFLSKPTVRVVSLTSDTAIRYAEIDVYLLGKGKPIPRNDVWIAASAMEHGSQLLTLDAHFRQIPLLP